MKSETFYFRDSVGDSISIPATDGTIAYTPDMLEGFSTGRCTLVFLDNSNNPVTVTGLGTYTFSGDPGTGVYHGDSANLVTNASDIDPTLDRILTPMSEFPAKMVKGKLVLSGDFTPAVKVAAICIRETK